MIKHQDGKWILFSKDGEKTLGTFDTEEEAKAREAEIIAAKAAQESDSEPAQIFESQRDLSLDIWERDITEATLDAAGNLSGIVVVEGESKKGNIYTKAALESGRAVFAGKPIYADHPGKTERADRPERSVRDLVGKLPDSPNDLWVDTIKEGAFAGRHALFYKNATLSETAGWLRTLIRERIAGAQSINAFGGGDENQMGQFVVEAFLSAKSLDFVTGAAAGGQGQLQESDGTTTHTVNEDEIVAQVLESMELADFAKLRPDIVDSIRAQEKAKAYGTKSKLVQEAKMSKALSDEVKRLRESVTSVMQQARRQKAGEIVGTALVASTIPPQFHAQVRQLVESQTRRFIEQEGEMPEAPVEAIAPVGADLEPGDPPTIEIPPDVAEELTPEQQAVWLSTYVQEQAAGKAPEKAAIMAWAAVMQAGAEVPPETAAELGGEEVFTEAALKTAVDSAISGFARTLSEVIGAGQITGMGGMQIQPVQESSPEDDEKAELASWQGLDLTEAEAKTAMQGRV